MTAGSALASTSLLALAIALGTGCASPPAPDTGRALAEAEYAIDEAARSVPRPEQSMPLYRARQKLERARELRTSDDADPMAHWLAEQALLDARYAEAAAHARDAERRLDEVRREQEDLRRQLHRIGGEGS
jgi:hypothetical protein